MIIYVPQSSIRHHCSKVHCSKLAWFAGAQHPISLLGRDARREDASCLFLAAMGGIRHQIKLLLIGVGRAQPQSTTIINDHQITNSSTTILHIFPCTMNHQMIPTVEWSFRASLCRSFDAATTIARHELVMVAARSGGPATGVQTSDALVWRETFSKDWDQHNLGK